MSVALANSFSSIASSALTTIVGLLSLVFMSFKIGMDLGLVLAKGVLISMICVFTVLPGLILVCTRLIQKTAKKVPHIPMGGLGRLSHKFRLPVTLAFIALFIAGNILQDSTEIVFTLADEDPIAEVIPNSNPIVLLYRNEDDEAVTKMANELLDSDEKIRAAVSYSTMLGAPYTAEELADSLVTLNEELDMDPELLKILYFDYFNQGNNVTMTASQFLHFLADDVVTNELFEEHLDSDIRDNIDLMLEFADAYNLKKWKSASQLADTFDMDVSMVQKILLLAYTTYGGADAGTMTLPVFADFVANELAYDPEYSSMFNSSTLALMDTLLTFTNVSDMTTPLTYEGIADLLGMDEDTVKLLFVYYHAMQDGYDPGAMTMAAFVGLVNQLAQDPAFDSYLGSASAQAAMLGTFADKTAIMEQKTAADLSQMLGLDASMINMIFALNSGTDVTGQVMSLAEFTGFANNLMSSPAFASQFDEAQKTWLNYINTLLQTAAMGEQLNASQLAAVLGMAETETDALLKEMKGSATEASQPAAVPVSDSEPNAEQTPESDSEPESRSETEDTEGSENIEEPEQAPEEIIYTASLAEFVDYAAESGIERFVQISQFIKAANNGMTADQLANTLGIDGAMVQQMFVLRFADASNSTMSAVELVDFLLNNMSGSLDAASLGKLQLIQSIMSGVVNDTAYTPAQMATMLGMDENTMKVLYSFGDPSLDTSSQKLSMQTIVNFLTDNSAQFSSLMGGNVNQLNMLKSLINGSAAGTAYTYGALADMLGMDATQLRQLYLLYQLEYGDISGWGVSISEFVNFIKNEVLINPSYASQLDEDAAEMLDTAQTLINAVLSGKSYDAAGLAELLDGLTDELDSNTMELLTLFYGSQKKYDPAWEMSVHQLFDHLIESILSDSRFESFIDDEMRTTIYDNRSTVDDGIAQMKGENYSRLILNTTYSDESEETFQFIGALVDRCNEELSGDHYFIGSSVMNYEMSNTFDKEMTLITLITVLSIYLVVALTFKSLIIPLILVLIVQCGVYLTVTTIGLQGYSIYYLALLIVQSILMGATIDYGILYTNYYLESRRTMEVKDALITAYHGSIHTILTSGLILILVTGIVGNLFSNPTVGQICRTISIGSLCASLLITFMLPSILAFMDRIIIRKKKDAQ